MTVLPPEHATDLSKDPNQTKSKKIEERLDELEILVRQNMQWSEIIYKDVKKIRRRLFIGQVWGWIKIMLLVAPFAAAAFFLPPYYRQAKQWYVDNIETPRIQLENNLNKVTKYLPASR